MLVLLPPSETKTAPARRGTPVDPTRLSFPALGELRERVLTALIEVSLRPDALSVLGVGPAVESQVRRTALVRTLPAMPAHRLYSGVLYDALGWDRLDPGARRRGCRRLVVFSALWGALRPTDRIPPYRLAMDVALPTIGPLGAAWRGVLGPHLEAAAGRRGVVVDCRSAAYAAAWVPDGPLARRTAAIRVLRDGAEGRTVVSHLAKHTRGEVARFLLESAADPGDVPTLAALLGERWTVDATPPERPGRCWRLDVVVPA